MSTDTQTVTVKILDKEYQVACPENEQKALLDSASHLDRQMRLIRQSGKVIGVERIAVMAALNITHEMLQQTERADRGDEDIVVDIQRLVGKVDDTISLYRQIEI
jgi:cell division protein ZapA